MSKSFYPAYPPGLTDEQAQFLLTNLKDWSIAHGLAVRPAPAFVPATQDPSGVLASTAPVTLFPSLFPRHCFEEGFAIQKAYNELYSAIARDEEWLRSIVEECVHLHPISPHVPPRHLDGLQGYVFISFLPKLPHWSSLIALLQLPPEIGSLNRTVICTINLYSRLEHRLLRVDASHVEEWGFG